MSRRIVLAVVFALPLGCSSSSSLPTNQDLGTRVGAQQPQRPTSLGQIDYSGMTRSARRVIADPITWAAVWAELMGNVSPTPQRPAVDFGTQRVVLVAMGSRPTGGYRITVDSLVEFENGSVVFVTSRSPGSACIVTQAFTAPVDIVLVSHSQAPFSFSDQSAVHHCAQP